MSLTAALRPSLFSLNSPASRDESAAPFHQESRYVALKRRLVRYQNLILLTPAPSPAPAPTPGADGNNNDLLSTSGELTLTPLQRQIQAELWSPLPYHRTKWLHNIEGARNLLLQLERTARNIKVQRTRQQAQKDLAEKRVVIKRLRTRIEEIGREVDAMGSGSWNLPLPDVEGESVWDILQTQTQAQTQPQTQPQTQAQKTHSQAERVGHADAALREGKPAEDVLEEIVGNQPSGHNEQQQHKQQRDALFSASSSSTVRRRGAAAPAPAPAATTTSESQQHQHQPAEASDNSNDQAISSGCSGLSSGERALLGSSRTQEALTTSMISMAVQLKQQAQAFQFSLEQDKGLLDRALEGLDKNLQGMQAAGKRMQFLQRMSEEQGWFGRLKLYILIMGMWAIAILLVFAGPKFRF